MYPLGSSVVFNNNIFDFSTNIAYTVVGSRKGAKAAGEQHRAAADEAYEDLCHLCRSCEQKASHTEKSQRNWMILGIQQEGAKPGRQHKSYESWIVWTRIERLSSATSSGCSQQDAKSENHLNIWCEAVLLLAFAGFFRNSYGVARNRQKLMITNAATGKAGTASMTRAPTPCQVSCLDLEMLLPTITKPIIQVKTQIGSSPRLLKTKVRSPLRSPTWA